MTGIRRTYPQPDSPREDLGPRERALAVFKYLMGLEPEEAAKHPRFELIVNAFENEGRREVRAFVKLHAEGDITDYRGTRFVMGEVPEEAVPEMRPSLVEELSGLRPLAGARVRRFLDPHELPEKGEPDEPGT